MFDRPSASPGVEEQLIPEDVEFNDFAVSDGNVQITANYVNDPRNVL
jgi:hypothetical protein